MTYTIAYARQSGLLLASVPDNADIDAAVQEELGRAGLPHDTDYDTVSGLTLTDQAPEDESQIVWISDFSLGSPANEHGETFKYAVRPKQEPI